RRRRPPIIRNGDAKSLGRAFALAHKKPLSCYRPFLGSDRRRWRRVMRYLFTAIAAAAVLLATGSASNRARAADVGPPYGPPSALVSARAVPPPHGISFKRARGRRRRPALRSAFCLRAATGL